MKLHRLTPALRRALAVTLSAAMALGLTACQQAQDTAGSTATAPAVETSESQTAAQAQEGEAGDEGGTASVYLPTEENENEQVVMNDQPESSYWFPEQLLEWDPRDSISFRPTLSDTWSMWICWCIGAVLPEKA